MGLLKKIICKVKLQLNNGSEIGDKESLEIYLLNQKFIIFMIQNILQNVQKVKIHLMNPYSEMLRL